MVLEATNTKPLTLTQGVVHETAMLSNILAFRGFNPPRLCGKVLLEKVFETSFSDKTNTSGIFLRCCYQIVLFCYASHLWLFQFTNREECHGNLLATHGMQEVALILVAVESFQ